MKPIMIPDIISPERKNSAEGKLFREFQSFQADEPIIILHSLGISEHIDNVSAKLILSLFPIRGSFARKSRAEMSAAAKASGNIPIEMA